MRTEIGYANSSKIKGVYMMRPKTLTFEQLVNENRQELLEDEKRISQIEIRLEKKQTALTDSKRK
jgi:hypothetical protein